MIADGADLTFEPRQVRIKAVLRDIRSLLNASTLYLSSSGLGANESESIRVAVAAELNDGRKTLADMVAKVHERNLDRIDSRIGDPLTVGVDNAKRSALPTLRDFQSSIQYVKRACTLLTKPAGQYVKRACMLLTNPVDEGHCSAPR